MENNENTKMQTIKNYLKSKNFKITVLATVLGGLGGFLYYYFVGCNSGSCAITSNPYNSIIMGSLLGFLLTNSPCSSGKC